MPNWSRLENSPKQRRGPVERKAYYCMHKMMWDNINGSVGQYWSTALPGCNNYSWTDLSPGSYDNLSLKLPLQGGLVMANTPYPSRQHQRRWRALYPLRGSNPMEKIAPRDIRWNADIKKNANKRTIHQSWWEMRIFLRQEPPSEEIMSLVTDKLKFSLFWYTRFLVSMILGS